MNVQLYTLDSAKQPIFTNFDGITHINLNALIKNNTLDISGLDNLTIESLDKVNLGNLASLCDKLNLSYNSEKCYEIVKKVVTKLRSLNSNIDLTPNFLTNQWEIDLLPYIGTHTVHTVPSEYIIKLGSKNNLTSVTISEDFCICNDTNSIEDTLSKYSIDVTIVDNKIKFNSRGNYEILEVDKDLLRVIDNEDSESTINLHENKKLSEYGIVSNSYAIVYVTKTIKNLLRFLGYTDSQIKLLGYENDSLMNIIPEDLLGNYPLNNSKNLLYYNELRELLY